MQKQSLALEELARPDDAKIGSDRAFGFVFAGFCALVAAYMFWKTRTGAWGWIGAAGVFACAAVFVPRALHPLNVLWFKFGLLLHHFVTPVVLGLMFFAVFTPIGLLMRLFNQRPLRLRFEHDAASYWIPRTPPGPPPASFNDQF